MARNNIRYNSQHMKMKCLIFLCFLFFIQMKLCFGEMGPYRYKCYKDYCDNWGECYLQNNTRQCNCMTQYYTGQYCDDIVNHCVDSKIFKPCSKKGTERCIHYFGSRYCRCKLFYAGETCNIRSRGNFKESSYLAVYTFLKPVVGKSYRLWVVYQYALDSVNYTVKVEHQRYTCSSNDFKEPDILRETLALPMYIGIYNQKYYCLITHTYTSPGKKRIKLFVVTPNGSDKYFESVYSFAVYVQPHLDDVEQTGILPLRSYIRKTRECRPQVRGNTHFCSPENTPSSWRPIMSYNKYRHRVPVFIIPCHPDEDITIKYYYAGKDKEGEYFSKRISDDGVFDANDFAFGVIWSFLVEVENEFGSVNYTCYCGARYSGTPGIIVEPGIAITTGANKVQLRSLSFITDLPDESRPSINLEHVWTCNNCNNSDKKYGPKIKINIDDDPDWGYYHYYDTCVYWTLTVKPTEQFLYKFGVWLVPFKKQEVQICKIDYSGMWLDIHWKVAHHHKMHGQILLDNQNLIFSVDYSNPIIETSNNFCISAIVNQYRTWNDCELSPLVQKSGNTFTINPWKQPYKSNVLELKVTLLRWKRYWDYCPDCFGWWWCKRTCPYTEDYRSYSVTQRLVINQRPLFEANSTSVGWRPNCNYEWNLQSGPLKNMIYHDVFRKYNENHHPNYEYKLLYYSERYPNGFIEEYVYMRFLDNFCLYDFYLGVENFNHFIFILHGEQEETLLQKWNMGIGNPSMRDLSAYKHIVELMNIAKGNIGYFSFSMEFALKTQDINSLNSIVLCIAGEFHYLKKRSKFARNEKEDNKYHELINYIFGFQKLKFAIVYEYQLLLSVYAYFTKGIMFPLTSDTVDIMAKGYITLCKETERILLEPESINKITTGDRFLSAAVMGCNVQSINRLFDTRRIIYDDPIYRRLPQWAEYKQIYILEHNLHGEHYYDSATLNLDSKPLYSVRNATNTTIYALIESLFTIQAFMKRFNRPCLFFVYPEIQIMMILFNEKDGCTEKPNLNYETATVNIVKVHVENPGNQFWGYVIAKPNPFWWREDHDRQLNFVVFAHCANKDKKIILQNFTLDLYIPYEKRLWYAVKIDPNAENLEDQILKCKLFLKKPIQPLILQVLTSPEDAFLFAYGTDNYPSMSKIYSSKITLSYGNSFYKFDKFEKDEITLRLAFLYKGWSSEPVTFKITIYSGHCQLWFFQGQFWKKHCEVEINKKDNMFCNCQGQNDLPSIFTGLIQPYKIVVLSYIAPTFIFVLDETTVIPIFAKVLFFVFILLLVLACYYDCTTSYSKKVIFLYDNREFEQYIYVVVTVTGVKYDSGTTSNVGIVLFGENVKSKRHILRGYNNNRSIMQSGSTDFFCLTTCKSLGELSGIYMWIDYAGLSPSWYCEKVYVIEKNSDKQWTFFVNKWFSLNHCENSYFNINRFIPVNHPEALESLALLQYEDLRRSHLWFSMFHADYSGSSSRVGKVLIAFGGVFLLGCLLISKYTDGEGVFKNFSFNFEHTIKNGFDASLLLFGYHCACLILLWQNPLNPRDFPWRLAVLGAIFIGIVLAFLSLLTAGVSIGVYMSIAWISAVMFGVFFDMIVIQTVLLILKGILYRWILKREEYFKLSCKIHTESLIYYIPKRKKKRKTGIKKVMFFEVEHNLRPIFKVKEKKILNYRQVCPQTMMVIILLVMVFILFNLFNVHFNYHNWRSVNEMLVYGNYSQSIGLKDIQNIDDYMTTTLWYAANWQIPTWMIDINFNILGVIRVRQTRYENLTFTRSRTNETNDTHIDHIQPFHCMYSKKNKLFPDCYRSYSKRKIDTKDKQPYWLVNETYNTNYTDFNEYWTERNKKSFLYLQDNDSMSLPIAGKFSKIPPGGYVTILGRGQVVMQKVFEVIRFHNWLDNRTRTIVIEFVAYGPNSHFFNNVKLVIERSYLGPFHTFAQINVFKVIFMHPEARLEYTFFMVCLVVLAGVYFMVIYFHHFYLQSIYKRFSTWIICDFCALSLLVLWTYYYVKFANIVEDLLHNFKIYKNNQYLSMDSVYQMYDNLRILSAIIIFLFMIRISSVVPLTTKIQLIIQKIFAYVIIFLLWILIIFLMYASLFTNSLYYKTDCTWWLECLMVVSANVLGVVMFAYPKNFEEIDFEESLFFWFLYPVLCASIFLIIYINVKVVLCLKRQRQIFNDPITHYSFMEYIKESLGFKNITVTQLRNLPRRKNRKNPARRQTHPFNPKSVINTQSTTIANITVEKQTETEEETSSEIQHVIPEKKNSKAKNQIPSQDPNELTTEARYVTVDEQGFPEEYLTIKNSNIFEENQIVTVEDDSTPEKQK